MRTGDQVVSKYRSRRENLQRYVAFPGVITKVTKTRVHGDVVRVDETDRRLAGQRHHIAILKMCIVIERDVVKTIRREEAIRNAGEKIVLN